MSAPADQQTVAPVEGGRRIAHVDGLRAAAVMLVVVMHAGLTSAPGDGGVVVFFVISGYIITSLLVRERERTGAFRPGRFYARRALKLFPPLVVLLVVPTLVYAAVRSAGPLSWGAVLSQIGFSYNWVAVADPTAAEHVLPGSEVVWSLAIEEQFYIVFALAWILMLRTTRWRTATLLVGVLAVVVSFVTRFLLVVHAQTGAAMATLSPERFNHVYRGTDTRIEAIALGVLLALAMDAHARGRLAWIGRLRSDATLVAAAVLFLGGSLLFRNNWTESALRPSAQELSAALLIASGLLPGNGALQRVFLRVAGAGWVQLLGLASYSIYLAHFPVIKLVDHLADSTPRPVLFVVNVVVGTSVGLACYLAVEKPVLRLRQRRGW